MTARRVMGTEVEYGITDKFQVGISVEQHYFHIRDVEELANAP